MRKIKFRAWDIVNKIMFVPRFLMLDKNSKCHEAADLCYEKSREYDSDGYLDGGLYTENNDHWLLMQYTGLKDKNGKDIYEGDIVKGAGFDDEYHYGKITIDEFGCWPNNWIGNMPESDCWEVIGNIYENPELLKND